MSRALALGGACVVVGVLAVSGCAIKSDAAVAAPPAASDAATQRATEPAVDPTFAGLTGPAPTSSSGVSADARCTDGTPVTIDGDEVGGFEGWWNSTPADADGNYADPSTWEPWIAEHPATAEVATDTGLALEVCDRGTGFDTAGYRAPQDHHGWPPHSVVLLDARTGKLLKTLHAAG
ncbi:hypothetical protein ACFT5B_12230 [Luteimicrobium sp. NPDC057192]|uniref:hypothetical protein n=1 Tax=Luteimicrobium sp. NPDC057192 TaxID=3346042 RepID=UPI003641550E